MAKFNDYYFRKQINSPLMAHLLWKLRILNNKIVKDLEL